MLIGWVLLALLLGLGIWGFRRVFVGYPAPPGPTHRLSKREMAFLAAAADAVYPPGGAIPPSGTEAGIPAHSDSYVAAVGPTMGTLMRLLFFLVVHATLVFAAPGPGGRRRFSSLTADQRVAVLDGWRTSRLPPRRLVFTSLRAILAMGYFACPAVLRHLRVAPYAIESPVVEADLLYPPVGRGKDAIVYTAADLTPAGPVAPLQIDGAWHPDIAEPRA